MEVQKYGNSVLVMIRVNPSSGRFRIHEKDGKLLVDVRNRPERGMVNREIVVNIGKILGKEVEIVKGHKSRDKLIMVRDASREEVKRGLQNMLKKRLESHQG